MSSGRPDPEATYRALVETHGPRMWRLAYRLTGRSDAAEDLLQETFVEAWRSIGALRDPAAGRAWLATILVRRAHRRSRRAAREPVVERSVDEGRDADDLDPIDVELLAHREDLQRALDALDPDRRAAFLLVFLEGFTCAEVADRLGVPRGTILSRIHRARGDLRRHLRRLDAQRERRTDRGSA